MTWSFAILRSWRLRAQVDRDHELVTHGPYAWVRHPIYLAVILFYLGTTLLLARAGFVILAIFNALAFDFRARVEEDVLKEAFGDVYRQYCQVTKRFIPWLY